MIYIFRHIIPAESYTFRHMPTANTYTFQHVTVLQSYTFRHIRPNKHGEIRRQRSRLRLIFCDLPCPRSKKPPPRQGTACLGGGFLCRGFCSFFLATFLPRLGKLPPICGFDQKHSFKWLSFCGHFFHARKAALLRSYGIRKRPSNSGCGNLW